MTTPPKKMRSLEALYHEALWGKLTQNEVDYVVQRIKKTDPDTDSFDESCDLAGLLQTLGRSGANQYRELVEKFLHFRTNGMVCADALRTLFSYWDFTEEYMEDVKLYIRGAEWDESDEARTMALSLAGEYLRKKYDRELLQLLLDVFEKLGKTDQIKDTDDYGRYLIQSCAYSAIARAMGKDYNEIDESEIERAVKGRDLNILDLSVIQKAHQRVEEKL
jgi:hypothetical protein